MSANPQITTPKIIYGTAWKKTDTTRLVLAASAAGFTAFDTANQPKHYQEPLLGEALSELASRGITRESLFLQTKFTPLDGQDQRVPYDTKSVIPDQVRQSFASSLEHLGTDYLDSYVLHGPYAHPNLGPADWEVWGVLEELYTAGKVRAIGISNVNEAQLEQLIARAVIPPSVVQNRCYANRGWNRSVRTLCRKHGIVYQGFSLLTANPSVLAHPEVTAIAKRLGRTVSQIIYRFSMQAGMVPLSGTTNEEHMRQAVQSPDFDLTEDEVQVIETLEG